MNDLTSIGLILLFALFAGHLVQFLRIPEVTGYIAAGMLVGPHVFGWITEENLQSLEILSQVALGLILFSIGGIFEASRMRVIGRKLAIVTLTESSCAAVLVTGGMLLAGQPLPVALLLGAVSIETAAASTLMVMRECNSSGPLTESLTGVIGMNNILCLLAYSAVATGLDLVGIGGADMGRFSLYSAIYPLVWQVFGGVALGFLIGVLLSFWSSRVIEKGETLILLSGCVLLCVGASEILQVSPLISSLSVGATLVNLSEQSRRLFSALSQTDPPLYAIFFVIAGADLNVGLVATVGVLGIIYVTGRITGKLGGTWFATSAVQMPLQVQKSLGLAMLSQAGLAIGLTLMISHRFPSLAPVVNTVVLASVVILEIVGPLSAKYVLMRSGEVRKQPAIVEPMF